MKSEKTTQIILGGFMVVALMMIVWFFARHDGQQAAQKKAANQTTNTTASNNSNNSSNKTGKYSVDNTSDPYKTLSLEEAANRHTQTNGELQAYYLGCRNCGHCLNLEKILKSFLEKYKDKNSKRDLIYKIEAGFSCVPETGDSDYKFYEKIYHFLVDNNKVEANEDKGFGTPQFYLVKNGKIVAALDTYGRSVSGLEKLFKAHQYRGF